MMLQNSGLLKTECKIDIRVLTVTSATDRQHTFSKMMDGCHGINNSEWSFFFAIGHEARNLSYEDETAVKRYGRTLSKAELSCFASHLAIIEDWLDEGNGDVLFILEDDVYLDPWYDFEAAARFINAVEIDYLRIYSRGPAPYKLISYLGRTQLVRFTWSPGGTQAFMLTRQGAARISSNVRLDSIIKRPIDDHLDRYWEIGNPVYGLFPSPVLEHNLPSVVHRPDQISGRLVSHAALKTSNSSFAKMIKKLDGFKSKFERRVAEQQFCKRDIIMAQLVLAYSQDVSSVSFMTPSTPSVST